MLKLHAQKNRYIPDSQSAQVPEYGTATGGFISLSVLIVFAILFASEGIKTVKKELISSTQTSSFEINPSPLTITTSPKGGFMFGVYLLGFDLSNTIVKMFDIKAYYE